jgi:hypothetical protein
MKASGVSKTAYLWAIVPLLWLGLFMRSASLGEMSRTMLAGDEAWNGVDIMSVIQHPHFTPFFENNYGRESGWMYFQVPFVLAFGPTPFALRFATVCVGMLTLAAAARLGGEIFKAKGAVAMLAALSVFYWHVQLSQVALRANTYMLMGALAAGILLHAARTGRRLDWVVGGVCLGLLGYTYFASYATIAFLGLLVVVWAFARPRNRWALLAVAAALVVLIPMGVYAAQHSDKFFYRAATTSRLEPGQLLANLQAWAGAWFVRGDTNALYNYPGRPILGPVTGLLMLAGLISFIKERRLWLAGGLTLAWAFVCWFPCLISEYPPQFLRASGLIVPIAITLTSGLILLGGACMRWLKRPAAAWLPLLLLLPVGTVTYIDFHIRWMANADAYIFMEEHINRSIAYLLQHSAPSDYLYFSPLETGHPVLGFRGFELAPRHVVGFGSRQCLVVPDHHAYYTSLTLYEPEFEASLARWMNVKEVYQDPASALPQPRFTIFEADPDPARLTPQAQPVRFGDTFALEVLTPFTSTIRAGDQVTVWLGIRPLRSPSIYASVFVHLYGVPTPYQGGQLWAQADSELCATYPASLWQTDETIVQPFVLKIPADIPPGDYSIAVGMYSGPRLPITSPAGVTTDYIVVHQFSIGSSPP